MYSRAVLLEHLQLIAFRFLAGVGAALSALWIRHALLGSGTVPWGSYVVPSIIAGALVVVAMWGRRPSSSGTVLHRVRLSLLGVSIATGALLALSFFYRATSYSRATVIVFIPLAGFALFLVESAHIAILKHIRANEDASLRVLIIGYGDHGQRIARALTEDPAYLKIVGYLSDDHSEPKSDTPGRNLGTPDALDRVLADEKIDLAIITLESETSATVQNLVGRCMAANVRWSIVPPMIGLSPDRIHIDYIGGLPVVSERGSRLVGHDWFIKRTLDMVVSGIALIVLSPFMAAAALAIRLTSPGPAIYLQERVGLNGRPFTLLKFRTMQANADSSVHRDYATHWIHGATSDGVDQDDVHTLNSDDRITQIGGFLRATSFDEVPQLWNVLRGDMSLVGPRPPIPYEVERYTEWHRLRLAVPPGVTGLWQVAGRNSLSFDEMIGLDLDYIERWTLRLDLNILIRTVPAVILHRGR